MFQHGSSNPVWHSWRTIEFEFDRVYLVLFMLNSINIKEKTNNTPNSLTRLGLKPLMFGVKMVS